MLCWGRESLPFLGVVSLRAFGCGAILAGLIVRCWGGRRPMAGTALVHRLRLLGPLGLVASCAAPTVALTPGPVPVATVRDARTGRLPFSQLLGLIGSLDTVIGSPRRDGATPSARTRHSGKSVERKGER
jgi:hypothetical protein